MSLSLQSAVFHDINTRQWPDRVLFLCTSGNETRRDLSGLHNELLTCMHALLLEASDGFGLKKYSAATFFSSNSRIKAFIFEHAVELMFGHVILESAKSRLGITT